MRPFWKSTAASYSWLAMVLHWLMLLLLVAVALSMEYKSIYPKGSAGRDAMMTWHYMLGLSAFCLVWPRLWVRFSGKDPVAEPPLPRWQSMSASVVQWALYALMIGLPLLGWLTLSAKGTPVPFFGLELPALIGKSDELAKLFKQVHEFLARASYFVVGLHAAAALYHHYVRRDNVLKLMLPGR